MIDDESLTRLYWLIYDSIYGPDLLANCTFPCIPLKSAKSVFRIKCRRPQRERKAFTASVVNPSAPSLTSITLPTSAWVARQTTRSYKSWRTHRILELYQRTGMQGQ